MSAPRTNAAFYAAPVGEFISASEEEVYAPLAIPHGYTLAPEQQSAWRLQLPVLRAALARLTESRAGAAAATFEPALHLATSMRSFRAESLSRFVKALLDGEAEAGLELLESFREQYPIVLTRSMRAARRWIRQQRRGTERAGLVAS